METDKIKADFQFLNNQVVKFSIESNPISIKGKTVNVNCDMDYQIVNCTEVEDGFLGVLYFIVDLFGKDEENDVFKIHLTMKGSFAGYKEAISMNDFKKMLEVNGTATLSQISRAYINSVTALSGMVPINLPMVNIYALKKYKENK